MEIEFESKIKDLFKYVRNCGEGKRLIIKIKSNVPEEEIYQDFAKIYRKYKILLRVECLFIGKHSTRNNTNIYLYSLDLRLNQP